MPDEPPAEQTGPVKIHRDFIQRSDEWYAARCGMLTASEMKLIITPTLKVADNDKSRSHLYELLAQRITKLCRAELYRRRHDARHGRRGRCARQIYDKHFAPVERVGFVTNDEWGFTLGCSTDGLVGDDGVLEIKSRRQKFQVGTIIDDARCRTTTRSRSRPSCW
jgi:hypothetical protein